jgi:hypothetical protein
MPNDTVPAAAEGLPSSRRGFLRGLTTLPLIGGGITLIGAPTAVAEPVSERLLLEYETWLGYEHIRIARELRPGFSHPYVQFDGPAYEWHYDQVARRFLNGPSSSRAALVLATVGCDWREGGR